MKIDTRGLSPYEHKQRTMAAFDLASEGYDCPQLSFFSDSAAYLLKKMRLKNDERLLDVATGTGHVAIAAARLLTSGFVTGIDLSEKMLLQAAKKADAMDLRNVNFKRADIEDMDFGKNTFDAASCAFGLFFLPDMGNGLKCVSRVLKPGGKFAMTSFKPSLWMPLRGMLLDRLRGYGIEPPGWSWTRLDSPVKIEQLLREGGYRDIDIEEKQMGYYLKDKNEYWDVLWNSGHRGQLSRLSETDLKKFKEEHLLEVEGTADDKGIWLEVEVLFATTKKMLA
ncbi:MAG: methyltransferase domain-containing protein [Nitrospiraceae bacterium]|nr:methyltransferase domain-containing protein [Nitrospiraceae bacterium]